MKEQLWQGQNTKTSPVFALFPPLTQQYPPPMCWGKTSNSIVCPLPPLLPHLLAHDSELLSENCFHFPAAPHCQHEPVPPFLPWGLKNKEGGTCSLPHLEDKGGPLLLLELFCSFLILLGFIFFAAGPAVLVFPPSQAITLLPCLSSHPPLPPAADA